MDFTEKLSCGLIGMAAFVLMASLIFVGYDSGRRDADHKFKLEQLKLAKPISDYDEILRRLERIERLMETNQ